VVACGSQALVPLAQDASGPLFDYPPLIAEASRLRDR